MNIRETWQHFWSNKTVNYSIRVCVCSLGLIIPCWYLGYTTQITPLFLGLIAAALAETDDSFFGRMRALILTFICFALASVSVGILTPYPWLFIIGFSTSCFGFIMIGSIGPRYAGIAFGSILIALYTMISQDAEDVNIFDQTMLLLISACWYYFVAMVWEMLFPMQPVQQNLALVFKQLAADLEHKSQLLHPIEGVALPTNLQISQSDSKTVEAFNHAKDVLLNRSKRGHVDGPSDRFLQVYFIAQDIHERIHSTYYQRNLLIKHFSRTDTLFRLKHVLEMQAKACRIIADALHNGTQYQHSAENIAAIEELRSSVQYLQEQNNDAWRAGLTQLVALKNNFATVDRLLSNVNNPDAAKLTQHISEEDPEDRSLYDTTAHTPKEMWKRIRANFTLESNLFRHALRMSIALTTGYAIYVGFQIEHGYWILLATAFVCQPNFNATQKRTISRIIWTIIGLFVGAPLLYFFTSIESHLIILFIASSAFFILRFCNQSSAVAMMTILVIVCFNQQSVAGGFNMIIPRLIDTLIGSTIALLAVRYILPNWGARRIHKTMANTLQANKTYFDQIIAQYRLGKNDTMSYRLARRNAHNMNASLSTAMSNIMAEPSKYQQSVDESFRFLALNHTMLSYLSALGTHRNRIDDHEAHVLILKTHKYIHHHLDNLFKILDSKSLPEDIDYSEHELEQSLTQWRDDEQINAILQQLHLIYRLLPEMYTLAYQFIHPKQEDVLTQS